MPSGHRTFSNVQLSALDPSRFTPAPLHAKAEDADPFMVHLLNRTTFGYREEELAAASALGAEAWLERQLQGSALDDGGLDAMLAAALPTLGMTYRELFATQQRNDAGEPEANPAGELIAATLLRQLYSPRQLHEVMVEFWTNHFNVFLLDGPVRVLKTVDDRDHIRPHALGRFRDLLHANAASPAMLYYLDNYSNTREGPNENYARELLELHTLGVDGGYGEHDVKEIARCFTGWGLNPRHPDVFVFDPVAHDWGEKYVLETVIPANRGIEDGRMVLDLLADHPSTARFLARKLCRRFIADEPPESAVDKVARRYTETDGDIPAMLRTLFLSDEFRTSEGEKFKRPAEFVGSLIRRLHLEFSGDFIEPLFRRLSALGQVPFLAVPPTGYADEQDAWLSTSSLLERWNLGSALAYRSGRRSASPVALDLPGLAGRPATHAELVDSLIERILHRPIPDPDRETLIQLARSSGPPAADQTIRTALAGVLALPAFQQR